MSDDPISGVQVLAGEVGDALRWVVMVEGSDRDLYTMLHIYRDGRHVAGSGFGGPSLYGSSLLNEYRGRTDDLPYFVMARTAPIVDRVVAITDHGTEVVLALSAQIEQFGLRFAAAALPEGEGPHSLRVEQDGVVLETCLQPMPRRFV